MKNVKGNRINISKSIVLIFVISISFFLTNYMLENSKNNPIFVLALTAHPAISITDDSGFSAFPGAGTLGDPYMIEDYNITTTSSYGIEIYGTTKYFVINNCYVNAADFGIFINHIADGTATITNNKCEKHSVSGIYIQTSSNNTLSKNNCTNNNHYGINLYDSNNNTLTENNCTNNNYHGIQLSSSSYNTLSKNNCSNNVGNGIYLRSSSTYNTLSLNNCTNNNVGIYLDSSNNNTLTENNCSYNNNSGIILDYSSNNSLSENICDNNNVIGIYQIHSNNNTLSANRCNNNTYGINFFTSSDNTLSGNNCSNNDEYGIYLGSSSNNTLSGNNCDNNDFYGIRLYDANNNTLSANNFNNNYARGIYLDSSNNNSLSSNNCTNNNYGIRLYDSNHTVITENILQDNGYYGLYIYSSSFNNLIYGNIFDNNNLGGTSQGYDDGVDNQWYEQLLSQGNSWSDWNGSEYYYIDGSANSLDSYPSEYPLAPPIITAVSHEPSTPTELETITISATVSDPSGIDSVTLHYRIDSGLWTTIAMTLSTGSTFQVTIGPFTDGSVIEYYITATDNTTSHNEATDDNSGVYYSFTVSEVIPEFSTLSPILLLSISILFLFVVILHKRKRT